MGRSKLRASAAAALYARARPSPSQLGGRLSRALAATRAEREPCLSRALKSPAMRPSPLRSAKRREEIHSSSPPRARYSLRAVARSNFLALLSESEAFLLYPFDAADDLTRGCLVSWAVYESPHRE